MEYWEKRLADTPGVTKLPIERPDPPVQTLGGAQQELRMPASLVQELHVLCSRQKVTLFMVLLAAWATLLHRYSGQDTILVSTPFANRNRGEVEGLIGMFFNRLVLRQLAGDLRSPSYWDGCAKPRSRLSRMARCR